MRWRIPLNETELLGKSYWACNQMQHGRPPKCYQRASWWGKAVRLMLLHLQTDRVEVSLRFEWVGNLMQQRCPSNATLLFLQCYHAVQRMRPSMKPNVITLSHWRDLACIQMLQACPPNKIAHHTGCDKPVPTMQVHTPPSPRGEGRGEGLI